MRARVGARVVNEFDSLVQACLTPRDAKPEDHSHGGTAPWLQLPVIVCGSAAALAQGRQRRCWWPARMRDPMADQLTQGHAHAADLALCRACTQALVQCPIACPPPPPLPTPQDPTPSCAPIRSVRTEAVGQTRSTSTNCPSHGPARGRHPGRRWLVGWRRPRR
jgi:hypothetical protein